jgi:hypothetical protein
MLLRLAWNCDLPASASRVAETVGHARIPVSSLSCHSKAPLSTPMEKRLNNSVIYPQSNS